MSARKSTRKPIAPGGQPGNTNASRFHGQPTERVSLRLPTAWLQHYRQQAAAAGLPLSSILSARLHPTTK